jgi:hypothetical protein
MKKYYVDVAPGGLEMRLIGPDGWQGPWRSTEPHGRRQIEADRRQRRYTVTAGRVFSWTLVVMTLAWSAALAALGIWVVIRVVGSW